MPVKTFCYHTLSSLESVFSFTSKGEVLVSVRDGLVSVRDESGPGVGAVGVVTGGVLDSGCFESCAGWFGCFWLKNISDI